MRLIDANALDAKLDSLAKKYAEQGRFEVAKDYSFVQTVLLTAPTVAAVEVCRCKDCTNFERKFPGYGYCYHWDYEPGMSPNEVEDDDFCSCGERRNNEPEKPV